MQDAEATPPSPGPGSGAETGTVPEQSGPAERSRATDSLRILVTIQHPAHVHFYRPIVRELEAAGHETRLCVRDKDVAVPLLEASGLEYDVLAGTGESSLTRAAVQVAYELQILEIARSFRPDVITAIGGVAAAHVAGLVDATSVVLTDSESATLSNWLTFPFADVVCTPEWYGDDVGSADHVRYPGMHELAYLHPDRFDPDPDVVREAGVDPDRPYSVVRFVSWNAQHDVGEAGLSPSARREIVDLLAESGDVYVTTEDELPPDLAEHRLPVDPEDVHHLLAFADAYVGDSQTMATEAAVLGTPAVRCNSFAAGEDMQNFRVLEEYGLLYSTGEEDRAIDLVRSVLGADPDEWAQRRERFLADTVDVTDVVSDLLAEAGSR